MDNVEFYERWWQHIGRTDPESTAWMDLFRERELSLRQAFGPTDPPNTVVPFYWDDSRIRLPGACALKFPPARLGRKVWFACTVGLTQPFRLTPPRSEALGHWEFGIYSRTSDAWCTDLLQQLMAYTALSESKIGVGHRIPVAMFREKSGEVFPWIKSVGPTEEPIGKIRACMFWPLVGAVREFTLSTGSFGVLGSTLITGDELQLAKKTSSAHLLLLLFRADVGQISDYDRESITSSPRGMEEWRRISEMDVDRVTVELRQFQKQP